jgi:hypothetical protein
MKAAAFWAAVIAACWIIFGDNAVHYAVRYNVPFESVTIAPKPHDCEFLTAPIGDKHCDYETDVAAVRTNTDIKTHKPIVSFDDGKTWNWDTGSFPATPSVTVNWKRVNN